MQITIYQKLSVVGFFVLLTCFVFSRTAIADGAPQVKTDKDAYSAGETIRVSFFNAPGSNRDWICIVPAESRDDDAGDYQRMPDSVSQGVLTFNAPAAPGKYQVRAYYDYDRKGYVVSARYSFSVGVVATPDKPPAASPAASMPASSASAPAEPVVQSASSPEKVSPFAATGINVAILYFTPLSIEASRYGMIVTNSLINHPGMQTTFSVLARKDLEVFLSANNLQQNDQAWNMVDIGTRLGLNYVIAGTIAKRGSRVMINYKIADVARRGIIYTGGFAAAGEADLVAHVTKMGDTVIEEIMRASK